MKYLTTEILVSIRNRRGRRNLRILTRFVVVLLLMVLVYSVLFHVLMLREGQNHTWITGAYWTLTVMSTLGFGDITFHTDLGRGFSILVLMSGMIFLLVLLPFTFIEFFYQPWIQAQAQARAPRELPEKTKGHVLLTSPDPVALTLIRRLEHFQYSYVMIVPELEEALRLHDLGINVMFGRLDDPETWKRARVSQAALVAATSTDTLNATIASTVRATDTDVTIVGTATREASIDVLELAGCDQVLRLEGMLGRAFSRRAIGGDALAHIIGEYDGVLIAEAMTRNTPLLGKTLRECQITRLVGVTVVGVWERGVFEFAVPDLKIRDNTVLLLAGSQQAIDGYNEFAVIYTVSVAPVLILGGGRVGRATARAFEERKIDYRVVELMPDRVPENDRYIVGDAADLDVLKEAGIEQAPTVIVTTHDDDTNVYLTVYCRKLRPDIQIISRATEEHIAATLHRAGADIVLSHASLGAGSLMNLLLHSKILMVTEGLDIFKVPVPPSLVGKRVADSGIRERSGCNIVAVSSVDGEKFVPNADELLREDAELVLVGSLESEDRFAKEFGVEL